MDKQNSSCVYHFEAPCQPFPLPGIGDIVFLPRNIELTVEERVFEYEDKTLERIQLWCKRGLPRTY